MFNIKRENLANSKVKLTISIPSEIMRGFFSRVYNKLAPKAEVKGFRPGMAPRHLTISVIGENRLNSEIVDLALQESYTAALKKENLLPVASPKINITLLKDLTVDTAELAYTAEVDVLPQVKIGNYKNLKMRTQKTKEIKVSDDELNQVLSHLRRQKATFRDISRPLKEGDRAEINFSGADNKGIELENLTSKNYPVILGSKVLIPAFEEKIIGMKKGENKDFKIKMGNPPAGVKEVGFKVEIVETQEVILPAQNDELAHGFQKKNLQDLKTAISEDIILQKKEAQKKDLENQVLEELLKIANVEIPASFVDEEIDRQINGLREKTATMGMTFEKYLESLKKTPEEFRGALKPQAEKMVKIGLALGEIVKRESSNWRIDPKDKEAGKIALEKLIKYNVK